LNIVNEACFGQTKQVFFCAFLDIAVWVLDFAFSIALFFLASKIKTSVRNRKVKEEKSWKY